MSEPEHQRGESSSGGAARGSGSSRAAVAMPIALVVGIAGSALAITAWVAQWSPTWFGLGLATAMGGLGIGIVTWSKALPIDHAATEEREPLCITDEEAQRLAEELELTRDTVGRRPILVWLVGGTIGALLAGVLTPLLELGSAPKGARGRTSWAPGRRVVTADGRPIKVAEGRLDQLATVFPEGHTTADDSQAVLLRVAPGWLSPRTVDGGAVDGWVAYSKICTHLGCSVGLFGIDTRPPNVVRQLVCPCHQSVFDPMDGAARVGGPAPRALPQLPLGVDDDGYLIATGDFPEPVGPLTWNEAG